jgi:hypothetical protein
MTDPSTSPGPRTLLADAFTHLSNLIRGEVALAKAEINDNVRHAGAAIGMIVAAVVIALTALNVLAAALVAALTNLGIPGGWSALIVGAAFAIVAFALAYKGMNDLKLSSIAPTRTARNLRRDAAAVSGRQGESDERHRYPHEG